MEVVQKRQFIPTGDVVDDLGWPLFPKCRNFFIFCCLVVVERKDFKFGTQLDRS